jgi:lipocalin
VLPIALVLVATACNPLGPPKQTVPSVDVARYSGTWYEIASIKQFFSIGLVNTQATYTPKPDGTLEVVNQGRYFSASGPVSRITGAARPLDATNARLNVSFSGAPSSTGPGNYWIVALDPDYRWAIVSDPTGATGFILSRTRTISPELKAELLRRAQLAGVDTSRITDTPQR